MEGGDNLGATVEAAQATIDTDEAYVQYVMEQAAISYADQQLRAEHMANYEEAARARSAPDPDRRAERR
jgi:hypothetical protein